jgi:hypothetical protein
VTADDFEIVRAAMRCDDHAGDDCPCMTEWAPEAWAALARAEARVRELEAALHAVQEIQPRRMQWFRDKMIVFAHAPLGRVSSADEGERWEQIAFHIYSDLCEAESIASAALAVKEETKQAEYLCPDCNREALEVGTDFINGGTFAECPAGHVWGIE